MSFLKNISINKKLIGLQVFTALVVIVICSVIFAVLDYKTFKSAKEDNIRSVGSILGSNLEAAILFDDTETIQQLVDNLKEDKRIISAEVYNAEGQFLFPQVKSEVRGLAKEMTSKEFSYFEEYLVYQQDILSEDQVIGKLYIKADTTEFRKHFYQRLINTIWIILVSVFIAIILGWMLTKVITRPLIELKATMQKVIKTNDFTLKSNNDAKDEVGKISMVFNDLLYKIQIHDKILSKANQSLERRVEERTHELAEKNKKLEEARDSAEQSRKEKEEFLASISHELRTPMNAVIGFVELLQGTELKTEQKEYLKSIKFAGHNLLLLINDILDLSKIEAGKLVIERQKFDLIQTLKSIVEMVDFRVKQNNNTMTLTIAQAVPRYVTGDEKRLTQILINLLGNATKFTDNGEISLDVNLVETNEGTCVLKFAVKDTGIGIEEDKITTIFNRFTQITSGQNKIREGTGLGLAIVKELIELQGGMVKVESEPGIGSTFTVTLGFGYPEQATEKDLNTDSMTEFDIDMLKGLKVLVVEDIKLNQQLVKHVLEGWGVAVYLAGNGLEALEMLENMEFDLILMDLQMPKMDGYEATKVIRGLANDTTNRIPIIALTAHANLNESEKCIEIGMNGYLSKPFEFEQLKRTILGILNKEKLAREIVTERLDTDIDLTRLKRNAAGDDQFIIELLTDFIHDIPAKLEELRVAVNAIDTSSVRKIAHGIKGILLTFGMNRSAKALSKVVQNTINKESHFESLSFFKLFETEVQGVILKIKKDYLNQ